MIFHTVCPARLVTNALLRYSNANMRFESDAPSIGESMTSPHARRFRLRLVKPQQGAGTNSQRRGCEQTASDNRRATNYQWLIDWLIDSLFDPCTEYLIVNGVFFLPFTASISLPRMYWCQEMPCVIERAPACAESRRAFVTLCCIFTFFSGNRSLAADVVRSTDDARVSSRPFRCSRADELSCCQKYFVEL